MKALVNNFDLYNSFLKYVERQMQTGYESLSHAKTHEDMLKLQGQLAVYRKLLKLREEINGEK